MYEPGAQGPGPPRLEGAAVLARITTCLSIVAALALGGLPAAPADARAEDDIAPVREEPIALRPAPLAETLTRLADLYGFQIVADAETLRGRQAPVLLGRFGPADALAAALEGAGLVAEPAGRGVFLIAPGPAPPPAPAQPQEPPRSAVAVAAPDRIVVTGVMQRERALSDVPASVTVLDTQMLEAYSVDSLRDASRLVPNMLGSSFTNTQPVFAIRGGANTVGAIGTSEPVSIYVDGIYVPRFSAADVNLFDLARVEVLRGPEGAFFGRNVTAGAILIETAPPRLDAPQTRVRLTAGDYGLLSLQAVASRPAGDRLAAKVAMSRTVREGYGRDGLSGAPQDDADNAALRASLLARLRSGAEVRLTGELSTTRNGARTLSAVELGDPERRVSSLGLDQDFERTIVGLAAHAEIPLGDATLVSITGARRSESEELYSFVGASWTLLTTGFQQVDRDFERPANVSQEFRMLRALGDRIDLTAGVYGFLENSDRIVRRRRLAAGSGAVVRDMVFDQTMQTRAAAAYADLTVRPTDQLEISAGLRRSVETRRARLDFQDRLDPAASFLAEGLEADFGAWTGRAAARLALGEDVSVYASLSRGFTAGGFFTEADRREAIETPFGPEFLISAEAGLKSRFAGGRGRLDLAVFAQRWTDKQEFVLDPSTLLGSVVNAADATLAGVEIEAGWRAAPWLNLEASYGGLYAEFDSADSGPGAGFSGNRLGNAPERQAAFAARLSRPVASGRFEGFADFTTSWTSAYFTGPTEDHDLFIESYALAGGRAGLRSRDRRWEAELFAENLFDTKYLLIRSDFVVPAEYLGPPRQVGVRLSATF